MIDYVITYYVILSANDLKIKIQMKNTISFEQTENIINSQQMLWRKEKTRNKEWQEQ